MRVDPTDWIAPSRVLDGADTISANEPVSAGSAASDGGTVVKTPRFVRWVLEAADLTRRNYELWVVDYDRDRQRSLQRAFLGSVPLFVAAAVLGLATIRLYRWWRRPILMRFDEVLACYGYKRLEHQSPWAFEKYVPELQPFIQAWASSVYGAKSNPRLVELLDEAKPK